MSTCSRVFREHRPTGTDHGHSLVQRHLVGIGASLPARGATVLLSTRNWDLVVTIESQTLFVTTAIALFGQVVAEIFLTTGSADEILLGLDTHDPRAPILSIAHGYHSSI